MSNINFTKFEILKNKSMDIRKKYTEETDKLYYKEATLEFEWDAVIKSVCDDCTAYPFYERGKTPLCGTCKDNPLQTVL